MTRNNYAEMERWALGSDHLSGEGKHETGPKRVRRATGGGIDEKSDGGDVEKKGFGGPMMAKAFKEKMSRMAGEEEGRAKRGAGGAFLGNLVGALGHMLPFKDGGDVEKSEGGELREKAKRGKRVGCR